MAKQTHDDLFEGSTMSFGEHLEELRGSLFKALIGIVVGCIVGFWVANDVVRFFQSPLEDAMKDYYLDRAIDEEALVYGSKEKIPYEVRQMILVGGMVPDDILMEASEMVSRLRTAFGVTLDVDIHSYQFVAEDIVDGRERDLARQLVSAGKSNEASPQRRLWLALEESQRSALTEIADGGVGPVVPEDRARLAAVLNALSRQTTLASSAEFKEAAGIDAATVAALRKEIEENPKADTRRLNKLLIAEVFPKDLRTPRLNLVALPTWRPVKVRFQVLNAQEAFMIWMKAALFSGLTIAAPWIFYQIWMFVAAGLYPHEKNYVYLYLPISMILFMAGASLAFFAVFKPVLDFLFTFNRGMNADFDPRIGEWLSFVLILPLGFGVSFQLPLVMLFVNRIGLVSLELYIKQWRIAILIIFVVSMVLTPADPISMLLMALPLCVLYALGILMCRYMPRGRNPFTEAYEP